MGRTALYRDPVPFRTARAEVTLDSDTLAMHLPEGGWRRHDLDGTAPSVIDGCVRARVDAGWERRFVRMLVLDGARQRTVLITPPETGAVAPNVVRVPEAPSDAVIVETAVWDALSDWVLGGGRLAACAISDLARLAVISSPQFAVLIGEVAAERALELVWSARGPLRGASDVETALLPLVRAARDSVRAGEALISALAHAAGAARRRRRAVSGRP